MVKYEILKPPTNNSYLNELNKKELKKYYDWYIALIPERLNLLAQIVKSTPGYSEWKMDFTPESLVKLGFWFYENIETRALSEKEIEDKHLLAVCGDRVNPCPLNIDINTSYVVILP